MGKDIENGKYKRLCPRMREDGIYVIRGCSELWMEMSYNKREVILLPYNHPFSRLSIEHKHRIGHHGVLNLGYFRSSPSNRGIRTFSNCRNDADEVVSCFVPLASSTLV